MLRRIAFVLLISITPCFAQGVDSPQALTNAFHQAQKYESQGKHFLAALTFFNVYTANGAYHRSALSSVAVNLVRAGLPNTASYFFIKTLKTGNRGAIRRAVQYLPEMLDAVGGDLLRKYIIKYTVEGDYDSETRSHFYYFLGKDYLLKGNTAKALGVLSRVKSGSSVAAQAAYIQGAAYAMRGNTDQAIRSFSRCRSKADSIESKYKAFKEEYLDLEARCTAGLARVHYQKRNFRKAEEIYDLIPKTTFVWTDILFEQAWNAYAKKDYNRTLGKLVTYRSPSLRFVFNPEVDVLRAQSFQNLCMYDDVNKIVNEFNRKYSGVGRQIKKFLLRNDRNLPRFYLKAKQAFRGKLHTNNMVSRAINRFARGPYFTALVEAEKATRRERNRIRILASSQARGHRYRSGFGGFLEKIVSWRVGTIQMLGGMFVRNWMQDLYRETLENFDRMSFIKLEMLKSRKKQITRRLQPRSRDEDGRMKLGSASVERRDYQYFWTFNGEFWADEIGDYVFALEPQCGS